MFFRVFGNIMRDEFRGHWVSLHFQHHTVSPRRLSWSWSIVCVQASINCKQQMTTFFLLIFFCGYGHCFIGWCQLHLWIVSLTKDTRVLLTTQTCLILNHCRNKWIMCITNWPLFKRPYYLPNAHIFLLIDCHSPSMQFLPSSCTCLPWWWWHLGPRGPWHPVCPLSDLTCVSLRDLHEFPFLQNLSYISTKSSFRLIWSCSSAHIKQFCSVGSIQTSALI